MGCFNVACSISNLSIGCGDGIGDECYFLPLTPGFHDRVNPTKLIAGHDGRHLVVPNAHLIYTDCMFQPFSLPILGVYDDYGRLDSIEKNDNTKILEEFFGIGIEDIIDVISTHTKWGGERRKEAFDKAKGIGSKPHSNYHILAELSGMFIQKDVYEFMVSYRDKPQLWHRDTEENEVLYDKLQQAIIDYDEMMEKYKKSKDIKDFVGILNDPMRGRVREKDLNLAAYFEKWDRFQDLYREAVKQGKLKKELCEFVWLDANMGSCNRFYFPAMNGEQHGNLEASKGLLAVSQKLIGKRIALHAEENIVPEVACKVCKKIKPKYVDDFCKECHLHYYGW